MSMVCPGLTKARHHGVHGHRGDILELRRYVRGHRDTELREHVGERLDGERRLAGLVARAVEPDHQAIADELVGTHPLYLRHILDALGVRRRRARREGDQRPETDENREAADDFRHGSHAQKGDRTELKKRVSQPMWFALAMTPLPE